jgi:NADPH-dependent 2,4-dienoyl-CoA reductase/sulfur reductase-like enzyme
MEDEEYSFVDRQHTYSKVPKTTEEHKCDVVVIGAGFTGINAAYLLKRTGLSLQ